MTDNRSPEPLQNVDPATISVWRIEGFITAVVLAIGGLVPIAPTSFTIAMLVAACIAAVGIVIALVWPKARYKRLRYGLDPFGLILQQGVLWRTQIALPRTRIQHSDVSQGPLQRRYGIATLKLYTAGSRYTKVELEGLQHAEAIALRDSLLDRAVSSD
jgi:membrane protein YdbS with pleckstrin-like domain